MSETTIGISKKLKRTLNARKKHARESYEDVLWRILKH
jgi:hypothetical protein